MSEVKKSIIQCKDITKTYISDNTQVEVIKGLTFDIYESDFTVIMGSSGSGKSTLLYLLSGLDNVTSGEVSLDGSDLSKIKEKQMVQIRRDKIGFVFQAINLVPNLCVFENITVPGYLVNKNKGEVEKHADELLTIMGLSQEKYRLPSRISGGQQQRAAIARALINSPKVLFADEPTGALNSQAGENVLDILTQINQQGQTVVMVTHDIKAATRANKILFLRDGMIEGTLELPKYNSELKEDRERTIFEFIKGEGW